MTRFDDRGCPVSGATPAALRAYERAFAASRTWRDGADRHLAEALEEAPRFVMAHVLQACLLVCSRDPRRVRSASTVLAGATGLPANDRERLYLAALADVVADDYDRARARLGELLEQQPRDLLALQVAHSFDYVTGDIERMHDRVAAVLPAWSSELPGYATVLAMHAFSLEESGEYARAEQAAGAALALDPLDARAHHAMAHVFEMTGRAEAGARWMSEHSAGWAVDSSVVTHCSWHLALFHLASAEPSRALALYDGRIRLGRSGEVADLIDAAALLWRVQLLGIDAGPRWAELARAWAPHIDDAFCSFNDLHAMLAFVGARDWEQAQRLERALAEAQSRPTRHGETTRRLGLNACRAVMALGRGDDALAITLLACVPARAQRLGGSHAQRDVLQLTRQRAIERLGRTHSPQPRAPRPTAAPAPAPAESNALPALP